MPPGLGTAISGIAGLIAGIHGTKKQSQANREALAYTQQKDAEAQRQYNMELGHKYQIEAAEQRRIEEDRQIAADRRTRMLGLLDRTPAPPSPGFRPGVTFPTPDVPAFRPRVG